MPKKIPNFIQLLELRLAIRIGLASCILSLLACDKVQPTSYLIPKENRSAELTDAPNSANSAPVANSNDKPMQVLPGMAKAAQEAGVISYKAPEGWKELPPSGIRKVNLVVKDETGQAELIVLAFPGDVGGRLANINRWRGQIGLEAVEAGALSSFSNSYSISGHSGLYVRLEGGSKSILGAMLPFHGYTWFFKFLGDSETVLANEAAMIRFIDSVRLEDTVN